MCNRTVALTKNNQDKHFCDDTIASRSRGHLTMLRTKSCSVLWTVALLVSSVHLSSACIDYDAESFRCYCDQDNKELECDEASNVPKFYPSNETFEKLEFMEQTHIMRFPPKAFQNLVVKRIIIKENHEKLKIHRKAFRSQRKNLEILVLMKCNIDNLPDRLFYKMKKLVKVVLSDNALTEIRPEVFKRAYSIKGLDLRNNRIKTLKADMFRYLKNLKSLELSGNQIEFMDPNAFKGLTTLKSLWLQHNHIRDLQPGSFAKLTSLESLDLSHNDIPALFPLMLRGMRTVKKLILDDNPLLIIFDNTFEEAANLEELHISRTKLMFLNSRMFFGLSQLQLLTLHENNITSLEDDVFDFLHTLKDIELNGNHLKTINPCAFRYKERMQSIVAYGNQLSCDCDMQWVLNYKDLVRAECAYPRKTDVANKKNYEKCKNKHRMAAGRCASHQNPHYETREEMSNAIEVHRMG